jgi:hypothetical protein
VFLDPRTGYFELGSPLGHISSCVDIMILFSAPGARNPSACYGTLMPQNSIKMLGRQWSVKASLALPSCDTYRLATRGISNIEAHWMQTFASWIRLGPSSWSERRAKRREKKRAKARSDVIDLQMKEEQKTQKLQPRRAEVLFIGSSHSAA